MKDTGLNSPVGERLRRVRRFVGAEAVAQVTPMREDLVADALTRLVRQRRALAYPCSRGGSLSPSASTAG